MVRVCMGHPAVPFVGEPVPDNLPETVPGRYGGYLRQGMYTKKRGEGAGIWAGIAENFEAAASRIRGDAACRYLCGGTGICRHEKTDG